MWETPVHEHRATPNAARTRGIETEVGAQASAPGHRAKSWPECIDGVGAGQPCVDAWTDVGGHRVVDRRSARRTDLRSEASLTLGRRTAASGSGDAACGTKSSGRHAAASSLGISGAPTERRSIHDVL